MASAVSNFFRKDEIKPVLSDFFQILIYNYYQSDQKSDKKDIKKIPICEGRFLIKNEHC